jgi:hypothetical protein
MCISVIGDKKLLLESKAVKNLAMDTQIRKRILQVD